MELTKALALFFFAYGSSLLSEGLSIFRSADSLASVQSFLTLAGAMLAVAAGVGLASDTRGLFQEVVHELQPSQRDRTCGVLPSHRERTCGW
mmetsp:Transcript_146255/g.354935  ORF Transcript_146255/g.354935 Transcript_146255/m.354935 type:complete len:92 (-) Transcript_146255:53-328(-)